MHMTNILDTDDQISLDDDSDLDDDLNLGELDSVLDQMSAIKIFLRYLRALIIHNFPEHPS